MGFQSWLLAILVAATALSGCGRSPSEYSGLNAAPGPTVFGLKDPTEMLAHIASLTNTVERNDAITQQYHMASEAMTRYLGVSGGRRYLNWYSFGQHASHQGGIHMNDIRKILPMFDGLHRMELGPFALLTHSKHMLKLLAMLIRQEQNISSFLRLYCAAAGIDFNDYGNLLNPEFILSLLDPEELRSSLLKVEVSLRKLHDGLAFANLILYQSMIRSLYDFLVAADAGGESFNGRLQFAGDDLGIKQESFYYYFLAAKGTGLPLQQRSELIHQANLLMAAFEQLTVQVSLAGIKSENEVLKGILHIVDPIGRYGLITTNWSDYQNRMGLELDGPFDIGQLTPGFLLDRMNDRLQGTIPGYFRDRFFHRDADKVFAHPGNNFK